MYCCAADAGKVSWRNCSTHCLLGWMLAADRPTHSLLRSVATPLQRHRCRLRRRSERNADDKCDGMTWIHAALLCLAMLGWPSRQSGVKCSGIDSACTLTHLYLFLYSSPGSRQSWVGSFSLYLWQVLITVIVKQLRALTWLYDSICY